MTYQTHGADPTGSVTQYPRSDEPLPTDRRFVSLGLTKTAFGFLVASASLFGLAAITTLGYLSLVLDTSGVSNQVLRDVGVVPDILLMFAFLSLIVTGIVVIVWFNIAYKAARSRGAEGVKWGSGWTIWSWFTPVILLFLPKVLMNQVDRMSHPDLVEPTGVMWKLQPRMLASDWWWGLWVAAGFTMQTSGSTFDSWSYRFDPWTGLVDATAYAFFAAAGVLLAVTVLTIGKRLKP